MVRRVALILVVSLLVPVFGCHHWRDHHDRDRDGYYDRDRRDHDDNDMRHDGRDRRDRDDWGRH
ncbi:MAG: hypothetical protein WC291_06710 [Thermodesulfovibrionales bacterium]